VAANPPKEQQMRISLTSVLVDNQDKALGFYTEVLGFVKRNDIPLGEARWLTVASPDSPQGPELLLEPDDHPAARLFKAGRSPARLPTWSTVAACRFASRSGCARNGCSPELSPGLLTGAPWWRHLSRVPANSPVPSGHRLRAWPAGRPSAVREVRRSGTP
jgi:hypothetical protein